MWWRRRPEPRINDADFNAELDRHLGHVAAYVSKPVDEFLPMVIEVRAEEETRDVLFPTDDGDGHVTDWAEFAASFGRALRRKRRRAGPPQAVLFIFPSANDDGDELIRLHGATPDGRTNAAALAVTRDEDNRLRAGERTIHHHPCDPAKLPAPNLAERVLAGFERR